MDCVVEGRSESTETLALFEQAMRGEELPQQVDVHHPQSRDEIIFPDKRTTFGVVEMTTGCGRRCQFCVPDLNPQIDLPQGQDPRRTCAPTSATATSRSRWPPRTCSSGARCTRRRRSTSRTARRCSISIAASSTRRASSSTCSATATIAPAVVDPVLIEQLIGRASSTRARFTCRCSARTRRRRRWCR